MKRLAYLDRCLGRTEHIYWLLDQLYCLNFLVLAEIEGTVNPNDLQIALDIVQQEHPVLRSKITLDKTGQPCFKPVSADDYPLRLETLGLRNWRGRLEAQLMTRFEPEESPLARFFWFRGKARKSVVAMVFHHSIADGRSGAGVLIDILRRTVGQDRKPRFRAARPSSQDLDLIKDKPVIAARLKEIRFWLDKGREVLKFAEQLPDYDMTVKDTRKIKIIPFSIPSETNSALLAACRDRGATIHGALGASLLFAVNSEFDEVESRYLGLNSLADLRSILKGNMTDQDLGLYISTLTTVHWLEQDQDFWHLAREIPDRLKGIMNSGDANLINGIFTEMPLFSSDQSGARKVQKIVAMAPPSSMLTNIGRINDVPLGKSLRIRSLGFAVSPPAQHPVCVTAASYGGQMCVNLLYDECKLKGRQARRITDNLERGLLRAADTTN